MRLRPLRRSELPSGTAELARFLIGKALVHDTPGGRLSGRIIETEAYGPGDPASHSYRGMTDRNRSMFLRRGHAYVYFIYGSWFCVNVSSESEGVGGAVLLRALEPIEGLEAMRPRRPLAPDRRLASGPGCLARALGIDRSLDGADLCSRGALWLGAPSGGSAPARIGRSARIGITKAARRLLRFYERGHPGVSGPRRLGR